MADIIIFGEGILTPCWPVEWLRKERIMVPGMAGHDPTLKVTRRIIPFGNPYTAKDGNFKREIVGFVYCKNDYIKGFIHDFKGSFYEILRKN